MRRPPHGTLKIDTHLGARFADRHHRVLQSGLLLLILLVAGIAFWQMRGDAALTHFYVEHTAPPLSRTAWSVADAGVKYDLKPQTLDELMRVPFDDLHKVDVARMNLLCASSLPGGEHLTPEGIEHALSVIDSWLPRIRFDTDRHMHRLTSPDPQYRDLFRGASGGSEPKLRMYMMLQVLQEDIGVRYDMSAEGNFSFANSNVAFIHGMIPPEGKTLDDTTGGTCASMPVMYVAVGRRLGYPLKLVTTDSHVFARWDGETSGGHPNPKWRQTFNIEGTGEGISFPDDDYYKTWPIPISDEQVRAHRYLLSLSPAEELAMFLAARGHCGEDHGQYAFAARSYENAVGYDPSRPGYRQWFAAAARNVPDYEPTHPSLRALMDAERIVMEQQRKLRAQRAELDAMMPTPFSHLQTGVAPQNGDLTSGGGGFRQGGWGNGGGAVSSPSPMGNPHDPSRFDPSPLPGSYDPSQPLQ